MSTNKTYILRPASKEKNSEKGKGSSISIPPDWIKKQSLEYGNKLFVCADTLLIFVNDKDDIAKKTASTITIMTETFGLKRFYDILQKMYINLVKTK